MKLLLLALFLISLDLGIRHWRDSAPVSDAPVFTLPMVADAMAEPGDFSKIVSSYKANRGAEMKWERPGGEGLILFYFEWDLIELGPMMDLVGHVPEQCNVVAGFTLESINPDRVFESSGQTPLLFDSTTLTDPGGRTTYAYKGAWVQGFGSRDIREGLSRRDRFDNSFVRGRGAARVIQLGISGAADEAQAWQIFQSEVLDHLVWSQPDLPPPASCLLPLQ